MSLVGCQVLVRFFALRRIKPHAPLLVRDVLLAVRLLASGALNSPGVTGGVYKARERIHRGMLIRDY